MKLFREECPKNKKDWITNLFYSNDTGLGISLDMILIFCFGKYGEGVVRPCL
jgi:hypothetical protein